PGSALRLGYNPTKMPSLPQGHLLIYLALPKEFRNSLLQAAFLLQAVIVTMVRMHPLAKCFIVKG
ncbi:MAG: hypothetical protein WA869_29765, partial [Alloacidobacterium sp.]